jgi:uncharacterized protein (TIGR02302 family)
LSWREHCAGEGSGGKAHFSAHLPNFHGSAIYCRHAPLSTRGRRRAGDAMFAKRKTRARPEPPAEPAEIVALSRRARRYLLQERGARVCAFLLTLALLFLTLSFSGLWLALGPFWRIAGVAGFFGLGLFALLRGALTLFPTAAEIAARIDADAPRTLSPAKALQDRLAEAAPTPATEALWAAHRRRLLAALAEIRLAPPASGLPQRDPFALRGLALVACVAAAFAAGDDRGKRLAAAFDWLGVPGPGGAGARVDAWITPPPYTGRPQLSLGGESGAPIAAPVQSLLHVRAPQGAATRVSIGLIPAPTPEGAGQKADVAERIFMLTGDATVELPDGRVYAFAAIPDQPPTIALTQPPRANARGSLTLAFRAGDDYGVIGAEARIDADAAPQALVPPPKAPLPLPTERGGRGEARATVDFSDSPWAGAKARLSLTARDEAGNEAQSEPVEITLPQRRFLKPLARALVEQRRLLVLAPKERARVAEALAALDIAPELFDTPSAVHLGLREAVRTLMRRPSDDALRGVADMLWTMALGIEDGDVAQSEKELRAAEKNLREALERGADDEEIARLTQELRAAMQNFLQGLSRDARRPRDKSPPQASGDGDNVTEQDLQSMLDEMSKAGKSGDLDEARRLLDQLEDVLENLQTAEGGRKSDPSARRRNAARSQSELDRLSREQQQLRDETYQKSKPDAGAEAGGATDEKRRQQELRERLQRQKDALRRSGEETPDELNAAEDAMKEAENALERGPRGRGPAVEAQGRALQALRRGADRLAEKARGAGQGEEEDDSADAGQQRGRRPGETDAQDPLGRAPQKGKAAKFDSPAVRARRLQEELRRRLGQPERPVEELDYLERLLKR